MPDINDFNSRYLTQFDSNEEDDAFIEKMDLLSSKENSSEEDSRGFGGAIKDTVIDVTKGAIGLGESVVGLADLATGNAVGDAMEEHIGYDPEKSKKFLSTLYSDERKGQNLAVGKAEGFVDTLVSLVNNPQTALGTIAESAPMMLGVMATTRVAALNMLKGAGIAPGTAQAAKFLSNPKVVSKLATISAVSEGSMSAGSTQESARQAGRDWSDSALPSVASGVGTAAIGKLGSKILPDVEATAAAASLGGGQRVQILQAGKEIAKGTFKEGVLEELPQSAQEQVWTNLALGKQWDEGIGEAAAQGLVAGSGMGAGMSSYSQASNGLRKKGALERAADKSSGDQSVMDETAGPEIIEPAPDQNEIQTDPESQTTIDAQIEAMISAETPKDSVFVANGSPMPTQLPEGAEVVQGQSGTLITTNKEKAGLFRQLESDESIASILGYGQSKNEISEAVSNGEETHTLVVKNKNGEAIHEELVSDSKLDESFQRLNKEYPDQVEVKQPSDVLSERSAKYQEQNIDIPLDTTPIKPAAKKNSVEPSIDYQVVDALPNKNPYLVEDDSLVPSAPKEPSIAPEFYDAANKDSIKKDVEPKVELDNKAESVQEKTKEDNLNSEEKNANGTNKLANHTQEQEDEISLRSSVYFANSGNPYKSEKVALNAMKKLDLETEVVPVSGGFGIRKPEFYKKPLISKTPNDLDIKKSISQVEPVSDIDKAANEAATSETNDTPQPTEAMKEAEQNKDNDLSAKDIVDQAIAKYTHKDKVLSYLRGRYGSKKLNNSYKKLVDNAFESKDTNHEYGSNKKPKKGISLKNIILQLPTEDGKKLAVNADIAFSMFKSRLDDLAKLRGCVGG